MMASKNGKSLLMSYTLLIFGGIVGLHHFYLGRDRHAFLYWSTLGGLLGLGCLRDFWRLPSYVQDANVDNYIKVSKSNRNKQISKRPPFTFVRLVAQVCIACIYGLIASLVIPSETHIHHYISLLFMATGEAIGVFTVANVGRHKLAITVPLYVSLMAVFCNV